MANTYRNSNQKNQSTMRRMVSYLRSLASRRSSGVVTADDAHVFLTRMGVRERQVQLRNTVLQIRVGSAVMVLPIFIG